MEQLQGRRRWRLRASRRRGIQVTAVLGSAALVSALGVAVSASAGLASAGHAASAADSSSSCHLANGIKHVISIQFDNTHFFRDNPNVPSDLQLMPNLLHFIQGNGTLLSNNHTPLIAHTANDIVTTFTGLYGDRHALGVGANSYNTYNSDGTTDHAGSFAYWTDPVFDQTTPPGPGHDTSPAMVYSATPPATTDPAPAPNKITPAPWVPFTKAGCNVGDVSIANADLENTGVDIPKVFGAGSPEANQLNSDPDHFKDAETADYVGVSVHCAKGSAFCADAKAVKFGQTTASNTAVPDVLPDEPGGYNGFQVTNAAGNLVDLNGNEIDGAFLTNHPGFPGFGGISPAQTLGYTADLLESGVPVVYGYISDLHGNHGLGTSDCNNAPDALATGTACYIEQAQAYNQQFGIFFKRLAADGITPENSLFIFTSDEGDHEAGANVGRFVQPTPAGCDGAKVSGATVTPDVLCTYPAGTFGELGGNMTGLLATQKKDTTPFSLASDSAPVFYVKGQPGPNDPQVRQLEHDVAGLTNVNPYTGTTPQPITNYLADPTEMAILHMVNADPARTPTLTMFAKPDYFFTPGAATCSGSCVKQNTGFAYDHGDYAAEIDTNWLGLIGPGVEHLGVDGTGAADGPSSAGPDSGQVTVPGSHTRGPWVDETDVRPTTLYLTGLQDDYQSDGRVITQILTNPNDALSGDGVTELGACYKQLNSSVGQFGTFTLQAATAAIESTSPGDATYQHVDQALRALDVARDRLAGLIKGELEAAAFGDQQIHGAGQQIGACEALIQAAHRLAT